MPPEGLSQVQADGQCRVLTWPDIGDELTALAPVRWSAQSALAPWTLVLRQEPVRVLGPVDTLRQRLLLGGLAGSMAFMALSWWPSGRVVSPLRVRAETARACRKGGRPRSRHRRVAPTRWPCSRFF